MACLGGTYVDVCLNERAYWRCVPKRVWTCTIGGYQVRLQPPEIVHLATIVLRA